MSSTPRKNIIFHASKLSAADRESKLGQKGAVVWFTGLSGSGKSTIAREVEHALVQQSKNAFVLDGDNIRLGLNNDLGFSPAERAENIRRIGEVAKLFCEANVICLSAFVSPYREDRARVRALIPAGRFIEVHCAATIEQCEARDVKGLYAKARRGEIEDFTGVNAPYEPPEHAELTLDTGAAPVHESVRRLLDHLRSNDII